MLCALHRWLRSLVLEQVCTGLLNAVTSTFGNSVDCLRYPCGSDGETDVS
jgi:hypothetical protein